MLRQELRAYNQALNRRLKGQHLAGRIENARGRRLEGEGRLRREMEEALAARDRAGPRRRRVLSSCFCSTARPDFAPPRS